MDLWFDIDCISVKLLIPLVENEIKRIERDKETHLGLYGLYKGLLQEMKDYVCNSNRELGKAYNEFRNKRK